MSGINQVMNKLKQSKKSKVIVNPKVKEKKKKDKPIEVPEIEEPAEEEEVDEDDTDEEEEEEEAEETVEEEADEEYVDLTKKPEDEKKLLIARAKEIATLQNDGVFRIELLYRMDELNKNLTILNGAIVKALDLNKDEGDGEDGSAE